MRSQRYLQIFLSLLVFICPALALGQNDLQDITDSQVMRQWEGEARIGRANQNKGEKWLPELHNFSRVFRTQESVALIDSWLGLKDLSFKQVRANHLLMTEYARSYRLFKSLRNNLIVLEVYIPHPRHEFLANFNLITAFAELEPPRLDPEYTEDIIIQQQAGHLHQHRQVLNKPKVCSILLKLNKGTRINIVSRCTATKDMIELANQLSLERFKKKLAS